MALTGYLTQNVADVEEMYRRMLFNYLIGNKDDHCKNFSFVVDKSQGGWHWRLAPAYDLTFSPEGYNGQHATSVNGKGFPTLADFIEVGAKIKISELRCRELISQVQSGCSHLTKYEIKKF